MTRSARRILRDRRAGHEGGATGRRAASGRARSPRGAGWGREKRRARSETGPGGEAPAARSRPPAPRARAPPAPRDGAGRGRGRAAGGGARGARPRCSTMPGCDCPGRPLTAGAGGLASRSRRLAACTECRSVCERSRGEPASTPARGSATCGEGTAGAGREGGEGGRRSPPPTSALPGARGGALSPWLPLATQPAPAPHHQRLDAVHSGEEDGAGGVRKGVAWAPPAPAGPRARGRFHPPGPGVRDQRRVLGWGLCPPPQVSAWRSRGTRSGPLLQVLRPEVKRGCEGLPGCRRGGLGAPRLGHLLSHRFPSLPRAYSGFLRQASFPLSGTFPRASGQVRKVSDSAMKCLSFS